MKRIKGVPLVSRAMDDYYKRTDYQERRGCNGSPAWTYFWQRKDGLKAQCQLCMNEDPSKLALILIPTLRVNTAGLFRHLQLHHKISIHKSPNLGAKEKDKAQEGEVLLNKAPSTSKISILRSYFNSISN